MGVYAQRLAETVSKYQSDKKWCWELVCGAWEAHLITFEEVGAIWDAVFGGGYAAQHTSPA